MPTVYTGSARTVFGAGYLKGQAQRKKEAEDKRRWEEEMKFKREELEKSGKSGGGKTFTAPVYYSASTRERKAKEAAVLNDIAEGKSRNVIGQKSKRRK
jgi:hypothetical protein